MTVIRVVGTGTVLGTITLMVSLTSTQRLLADEPANEVGGRVTTPTLRRMIEDRFGRPDRTIGNSNSLLCYDLANGDTLTLVVADGKVVGIEHIQKTDLHKVVGETVTLVGVHNELAKSSRQMLLADGHAVELEGRKIPKYGKLVSITGMLKYSPGTSGPADNQQIPPHYYMESDSVEIKVLYPFTFLNH